MTVQLESADTTVTSIYVHPCRPWDARCLLPLSACLGQECVLCGDFNAHHTAWSSRCCNTRGT